MPFDKTSLRALALLGGLAAATAASAHPGHGTDGLAAGVAHPFLGADHLLAMVAVGLWSAATFAAKRCAIAPALFLATLLAGALLAVAGATLPFGEAGVALSVAAFGVLLIGGRRVPATAGLALVGLAGLLHGHAHGGELAAGHSFVAYAAGFMAASALLHVVGLLAGLQMRRLRPWAWRVIGAAVGASGLAMLATRL